MNHWKKYFDQEDIFFITPDVKRGVGFAGILPKYHVICSAFDPLIPVLKSQGANIFCLEEAGVKADTIQNSGKILSLPQVSDYIKSHSQKIPKIMYFKPSLKLDQLIAQYGFSPIGNNSKLNELFEDKVNFAEFLENNQLTEFSCPMVIGILGKLDFPNLQKRLSLPFVVQFGHGWAGKTTFFVSNEVDFEKLSQKFPYTRVKISKYIEGFAVLNNCCVYQDKVLVSAPAIQIDSISQIGARKGMTCGRQWPARFIDEGQSQEIGSISQKIGKLMKKAGYRGFFGLDFLIDGKNGKVFLSEINARMTASSAFFTLMETGVGTIPLLAFHLAEFTGKTLPDRVGNAEIAASQIIIRKPYQLENLGNKLFSLIKYKENKIETLQDRYFPQNLKKAEYIFMGRSKDEVNQDDEYGRIETKEEVLEDPGKLTRTTQQLISLLSD